jgi:hypothetical protein
MRESLLAIQCSREHYQTPACAAQLNDDQTAAALKDLQRIPGIGPSLARDLVDLDIRRVADLRRRNPERLYEQLIALRRAYQDRCVLYTFRCAVYFANEPNPDPRATEVVELGGSKARHRRNLTAPPALTVMFTEGQ